jgi:hypothetical protein
MLAQVVGVNALGQVNAYGLRALARGATRRSDGRECLRARVSTDHRARLYGPPL